MPLRAVCKLFCVPQEVVIQDAHMHDCPSSDPRFDDALGSVKAVLGELQDEVILCHHLP